MLCVALKLHLFKSPWSKDDRLAQQVREREDLLFLSLLDKCGEVTSLF